MALNSRGAPRKERGISRLTSVALFVSLAGASEVLSARFSLSVHSVSCFLFPFSSPLVIAFPNFSQLSCFLSPVSHIWFDWIAVDSENWGDFRVGGNSLLGGRRRAGWARGRWGCVILFFSKRLTLTRGGPCKDERWRLPRNAREKKGWQKTEPTKWNAVLSVLSVVSIYEWILHVPLSYVQLYCLRFPSKHSEEEILNGSPNRCLADVQELFVLTAFQHIHTVTQRRQTNGFFQLLSFSRLFCRFRMYGPFLMTRFHCFVLTISLITQHMSTPCFWPIESIHLPLLFVFLVSLK